jgi:hypothetical protein
MTIIRNRTHVSSTLNVQSKKKFRLKEKVEGYIKSGWLEEKKL